MQTSINVHKTGMSFFRKSVVEEGYVGKLDMIANAVTLTIIKPNTSLIDVKRSLEITLQDVKLRMSQEEKK